MRILKLLFSLVLIITSVSSVHAQDATCAQLIEQALNTVDGACRNVGRNQACYGNIELSVTVRDGVANPTFEQAGDLVNVADIQSLRLSALDEIANSWGIAFLYLQANLPENLPGQNVPFLLFGNVEMENAVERTEAAASLEIVSTGAINVRTGPSTDFAIAGSLRAGETVIADGRNSDASWLRIQIPDSSALGWVFTSLMTVTDEIDSLQEVDAEAQEIPLTPMQAFYFQTSLTGVNCTEAPPDGILIQTPEGLGTISLRANDVDIQLGSTAFLQAQPSGNMTVSVIEGVGEVTADGVTVRVPAGTQVTIPLDANLSASGAPSTPQPYTDELILNLPIRLLPRAIVSAPPADPALLAALSSGFEFGGVMPQLRDFSAINAVELTLFCPLFGETLANNDIEREAYLRTLNTVLLDASAEDQVNITLFIERLETCS